MWCTGRERAESQARNRPPASSCRPLPHPLRVPHRRATHLFFGGRRAVGPSGFLQIFLAVGFKPTQSPYFTRLFLLRSSSASSRQVFPFFYIRWQSLIVRCQLQRSGRCSIGSHMRRRESEGGGDPLANTRAEHCSSFFFFLHQGRSIENYIASY